MSKKILFIIPIVLCFILIFFIFKEEDKELYSLDELKELLGKTKVMNVCRYYDRKHPYKSCSRYNTIKSVSDEKLITEIVSIFKESQPATGDSTMEGAGDVIQVFDKDGNFLMNAFFYPYIGLEKGESLYILAHEREKRIKEIFTN